jgi:hypothetical protein
MRVSPKPTIVSGRRAMTRTPTGSPPAGVVPGVVSDLAHLEQGTVRKDPLLDYLGRDPAISSSVEDAPKLAASDDLIKVSCTSQILCL